MYVQFPRKPPGADEFETMRGHPKNLIVRWKSGACDCSKTEFGSSEASLGRSGLDTREE